MSALATPDVTRPILPEKSASRASSVPALAVPVARALLSAIFLFSGPAHFTPGPVAYARAAGVPFANVLVPLAGVLAMIGGLSVLLGFRARLGAAMLIAFLVPVTLSMHAFWAVRDPQMAQLQFVMFMKNLGLLGGALLVAYFGGGPWSLDSGRSTPETDRG